MGTTYIVDCDSFNQIAFDHRIRKMTGRLNLQKLKTLSDNIIFVISCPPFKKNQKGLDRFINAIEEHGFTAVQVDNHPYAVGATIGYLCGKKVKKNSLVKIITDNKCYAFLHGSQVVPFSEISDCIDWNKPQEVYPDLAEV